MCVRREGHTGRAHGDSSPQLHTEKVVGWKNDVPSQWRGGDKLFESTCLGCRGIRLETHIVALQTNNNRPQKEKRTLPLLQTWPALQERFPTGEPQYTPFLLHAGSPPVAVDREVGSPQPTETKGCNQVSAETSRSHICRCRFPLKDTREMGHSAVFTTQQELRK